MTVTCLLNFKRTMMVLLSFAIALNTFSQTHKPITTFISPNIGGYWEYLPADYATSNKTYPLLLFFHGKAERGTGSQTDLQLVLTYGPPKVINDGVFPSTITVGGKNYSFIVISPQLENTAIETAQDFNILMNYIRHHYRIDDSRVYLTGLSLGAGRILYSAASSMSNANSVAAMVAASTDWTGDTVLASNIGAANVPLWLATNTQDPTIPYTYTVWWKDFLGSYTPPMNPQPILDTFGVKGHDSWTQLFDPNFRPRGVNVYEWLLQYNRGMDTATRHVYPYVSVPDTVTLPVKSIKLDGTASSTDSGALLISYQWKVLSGPAGYQLSNSTSSIATLTKLSPGKYTVQLTVANNKGVSGSSNAVIVTVQGQNPLAVAQAPSSISLPVDSVTLDGSASYDPLGTIASYNWSCISGQSGYVINNATNKVAKVTGLTGGIYDFVLKVKNNRGYESSDTVSVLVKNAVVTGPVAVIRNPGLVTATSATLDASASYTATGRTISKWQWNYISGPKNYILQNSLSAVTKISNLVNGTYTFQVKVSDASGSGSGRVTFTVNLAAATVNAVINGPASIALPADSVLLDGSSSTSSNGNLTYNWAVISGPAGYVLGSNVASVFKISKMSAGIYRIVLTAKNATGQQDADTATVTVSSGSPTVKAIINAPASITLPIDSVLLDGSSSYSSNGGLTYNWIVLSGPSGYTLSSTVAPTLKVSKMKAGSYSFRLIVRNGTGQVDSTMASVAVNAATPTVKAIINAPASITLPVDSVALDGSSSTSSNGGLTYKWNVVSGPAGYILGSTTASVLKVTKMSAGTYVFALVAKNGTGQQDSTNATVVVNPAAATGPVAVIVNPGTVTTSSVTLDASGSYTVPGRTITSYLWNYMSGPKNAIIQSPNSAITTVTNLTNGTYTYRVKVTDKAGSNSQTVTFTVNLSAGQRIANAAQHAEPDGSSELNEPKAQQLKLSPVPTTDQLNLSMVNASRGKVTVNIADMSGRIVLRKNGADKNAAIWNEKVNVTNLSGGSYFITVAIGNETFSGRFVKLSN